ncbi:enoyl-CoA hydratase-related protein [Pusillimonas sp. SM2304]|uniref:enoyl-CoA hydratase/isomerase family protein n=1 Tax=Pusillimonas sp. SM2304 TaxID=3073241 RepID=UPI0028765E97|nr:enoyl-CoA hydratase-related protein [Pusillimonas sp. SM2304]MDS1141846.1 enoyl-CoA hydratase-related protein [Pusillimonas sp. SM2304]
MAVLVREKIDKAVVLTLNRPESMNALSHELVGRLIEAIKDASEDPDCRSIILTGAGDKAFCAGTDLKERRSLSPEEKWAQSRGGWNLNQALFNSPKAVIAAVGGWCLGGGFELALYCDIRIAADDARFGWPEMTLGAYPGSGAALMLPRIVGPAQAKLLFFTARRIDAHEAYRIGLVERVVSRPALLEAALEFAGEVERTSPLGLAAVKRSVNQGSDLPLDEAAKLDQMLRRPLEGTRDYEEGIRAHFEKRKPVFAGR